MPIVSLLSLPRVKVWPATVPAFSTRLSPEPRLNEPPPEMIGVSKVSEWLVGMVNSPELNRYAASWSTPCAPIEIGLGLELLRNGEGSGKLLMAPEEFGPKMMPPLFWW